MMVIVAVVQLTDTFPVFDRLARIETAALRSGLKDISSIAVPGVIDVLNARVPQAGDRIGASKLLEEPRLRLEPDPEGGRRGGADHQPENAADDDRTAVRGRRGRLGFDEGESLPGYVCDTVEVDLLCRAARRSFHRPPSSQWTKPSRIT
jgi:hypothetical protein